MIPVSEEMTRQWSRVSGAGVKAHSLPLKTSWNAAMSHASNAAFQRNTKMLVGFVSSVLTMCSVLPAFTLDACHWVCVYEMYPLNVRLDVPAYASASAPLCAMHVDSSQTIGALDTILCR